MPQRIIQRYDLAANWAKFNPVLGAGEHGYESDTEQYKIGDGVSTWSQLEYRGLPAVQQTGSSKIQVMSQESVTLELKRRDEDIALKASQSNLDASNAKIGQLEQDSASLSTTKADKTALKVTDDKVNGIQTNVNNQLQAQDIDFQQKAAQEFEKNKTYVDGKSIEIAPLSVTPETLSEATKQYIEGSGGGTITNLADDEDLVSESNVLKFKDKAYQPSNFSGLGRKILRKNIDSVSGKNTLTQEMINQPNTVYEIQYDYDLNGATITIPTGCILRFAGGSISNGVINGDFYSIVADYVIFKNISGTISIKTDIYSIWFGSKTSDVNSTMSLFPKQIIYLPKELLFDKTIEVTAYSSLVWESGIIDTSSVDIPFLKVHAGRNMVRMNGSVVEISKTRTTDVVIFYGDNESVNGQIAQRIYSFPLVSCSVNVWQEPTPNCAALSDECLDENSQFLYNTNLKIAAYRVNTAVRFTQNIENVTNITDNVLDIISWNCDNAIRFVKDATHKISIGTDVFNIMFQPSPNTKKAILIDNYTGDEGAKSTFNITMWDLQYITNNAVIDRFIGATYNSPLKLTNPLSYYFTDKKGACLQQRRCISEELLQQGKIFISDSWQMTYVICTGITLEDTADLAVKKLIYNILNNNYEKSLCIDLPFSTNTSNSILPASLSLLIAKFLPAEFEKEYLSHGIFNLEFIGYDSGRVYKTLLISFSSEKFTVKRTIGFTYTSLSVDAIIINTDSNSFFCNKRQTMPTYNSSETLYDNNIYFNQYYKAFIAGYKTRKDSQNRNEILHKRFQNYISGGFASIETFKTEFSADLHKGFIFYCDDIKRPFYWDGYDFRDDRGFYPVNSSLSGTTANRPIIASGINYGFQYYDTTLKKYICWNGTMWVNLDGTPL